MSEAEPENPFAADVPGVEVKPATYVLFGASGDLAAKKLLPAVYNLYAEGRLPERFRLLGIGSSMPRAVMMVATKMPSAICSSRAVALSCRAATAVEVPSDCAASRSL